MGALEVLWGERQGGVGWERRQEEAKKWASSLLTSVRPLPALLSCALG